MMDLISSNISSVNTVFIILIMGAKMRANLGHYSERLDDHYRLAIKLEINLVNS